MWFWKGGKGGGKGGPPNTGKGNYNRRHYIQCQTTGCNGHVFQQLGTSMPDKCKVCNFCNCPFVIPVLQGKGNGQKGDKGAGGAKGGNQISPKVKKDAAADAPVHPVAATVAPAKITALYSNLMEHGYTEEAALEQLASLGLTLPKKIIPKSLDDYEKLVNINREIKQYENEIRMQSDKLYKLEQTVNDLIDTILAKQQKLADLKTEKLSLHQAISKATDAPVNTEARDQDKASLNAVLIAELEKLSTMSTIISYMISTQPGVPSQVRQLCSRLEYIKGLTEKTFENDFNNTDAFVFVPSQQDITSDDLKNVGDDGGDEVWPEGFCQDVDVQPEVSLAVVSGEGCIGTPPPLDTEEYPSYNMASWNNIKKKSLGLNCPRPAKVFKSSPVSDAGAGARAGAQANSSSAAKAADE